MHTLFNGQDVHLLTGLQSIGQGHHAAVDLGAAATSPQLGVNMEGEIQAHGLDSIT